MSLRQPSRVVHLELHTHDHSGASAFYRQLLGWRTERIDPSVPLLGPTSGG
jgi:predicted enzyme related to lactoylglutathione lyase